MCFFVRTLKATTTRSHTINMAQRLEDIPTLIQRYGSGDLKPAATTCYPVDKAILEKVSLQYVFRHSSRKDK